jgi:hypothetical protein
LVAIPKSIPLAFAVGPVPEWVLKKLSAQEKEENYENDSEDVRKDDIDDSMMGVRILHGFRKKDMAYILFHNDDTYMFPPAFLKESV